MVVPRGSIVLCILCGFVSFIDASNCPEPRKPHVTSCTIFYDCIDLPEGGYVWAPARCTDGLVFQPYLRICVLPGDTWTCDDLATESAPTSEIYEISGSTKPLRTSYLGYDRETSSIPDRSSYQLSHPIDEFAELGNVRRTATPYPLIEILDTREKNNRENEKSSNNAAASQTVERRVENYLYQFFNSQQNFPSTFDATTNDESPKNRSTWLRSFINGIMLYEKIGGSSNRRLFHPNAFVDRTANGNREWYPDDGPKSTDYSNNFGSDAVGYVVRSYVRGIGSSTVRSKKKNKKTTTTTTTSLPTTAESDETPDDEIVSDSENSGDEPTDFVVDGPISGDSVLAVRGNLGGKEYVTHDRYKSLSEEMTLDVVEIVPCAKGVRLPNRTDCTKYYTCDPATAIVAQFSCSPKTSFNRFNRVCEARGYKNCVEQSNASATKSSTALVSTTRVSPTTRTTESTAVKNPCRTTGKFADPETDRNYYVCYTSQTKSGGVDYIVMTCPNNLIFCQKRRLCTTRKRCYD